MPTKLYPLFLLTGLTCTLVLGCAPEEEIRSYKAPRPAKVHHTAAADKQQTRLLGAIFPRGNGAWVFKLSGPEAAIAKQEEVFDKLLQTVRFDDQANPPITWTTPEGWKHEPGKGLRFATLRRDSQDDHLEITLSQLEGEQAASVESNVKRWCGQLGLSEPTPAELTKYCTPIEVAGAKAVVVKISGSSSKGPLVPPFAKQGGPEIKPPPRAPITFTRPEGWTEFTDPKDPFSVVTFRVGEGDQAVKITTTPLFGTAGGLAANVNRWRGQIGLPEASPEQLNRDIREIKIASLNGHLIDLIGPDAALRRERIVGIVLPHGNQTWFFKMRGPVDQVERQLSNFQAYVDSVKFPAP